MPMEGRGLHAIDPKLIVANTTQYFTNCSRCSICNKTSMKLPDIYGAISDSIEHNMQSNI